jgi:N-methylhydantoinase A/oxoprolinase/acetone carboxylase beta subunit
MALLVSGRILVCKGEKMLVGLDVGGTHTDVVVIEGRNVVRKVKLLTEHDNLLETVGFALLEATKDVKPEEVQRVVVSTTLATNAIVQGKIEPVGMIVASGPGMNPYSFRIGDLYYPVSGAIDHRGREVAPIKPAEIEAVSGTFKAAGIRNVALVGKFSVRNPAQELRIRELLGDGFENVTLGHRVAGHLNFPRRIASAYLNAAVTRINRRFYDAVRGCIDRQRLAAPLEILKADGGTMAHERSLEHAVETILSGPAASVMGALPFADRAAEEVVLDIGGTTTDIALLVDGAPLLKPLGIDISGYKTLVRALRTHSIGVGGDSWVRVEQGELKVGPERKGRATAYGGPEPTPTDALIVLGARTQGQTQRALEAIRWLAYKLGTGVEETANAVVDRTCALILEGVRELVEQVNREPVYTIHELLEGRVVKPTGLLVIGGPAREFAPRLEAASGWHARVPPDYEVANAIGAAVARTTCEVTIVADTERGSVCAPAEGYMDKIDRRATKKEVVELAFDLLRKKAMRLGAGHDELAMELLEEHEFNMVRGFSTVGRSIRVRAQIKPGLIRPYREAAA